MNRSLPPEIAAIEAQIRVWHPDVKALCMALADRRACPLA